MNVHQIPALMVGVVQITLTDILVHAYLGILDLTAKQVLYDNLDKIKYIIIVVIEHIFVNKICKGQGIWKTQN